MNIPASNPPELLAVPTGGTVILLTAGQRRVRELYWREKREIFHHPYIIIENEETDAIEIINTAHIISVK